MVVTDSGQGPIVFFLFFFFSNFSPKFYRACTYGVTIADFIYDYIYIEIQNRCIGDKTR